MQYKPNLYACKHAWNTQKLKRVGAIFMIKLVKDEVELRHFGNSAIRSSLSFVACFYLTLTRYSVASFYCSRTNGIWTLVAYPEIECWTSSHVSIIVPAVFGLLVYVCGFPIIVARILLHIHRNGLHTDQSTLDRYGFLYDKYDPHAFFYELVLILRRFVFGIISVFSSEPRLQCLTAQMCLMFQFGEHTCISSSMCSWTHVCISV